MAQKAQRQNTFHEQWYLVENLVPRLRAELVVRRQVYWGTPWYILSDPDNNMHFRLAAPAYRFIALLDGRRSVQEAWEASRLAVMDLREAGVLREGAGDAALFSDLGGEGREEEPALRGGGEEGLTQGEAIALLGRLHSSNLLLLDMPADTEKLLRRKQEKTLKKVGSVLSSFLFLRIPVFTPDAFFTKYQKIGSLLFRPVGVAAWLILCFFAARALVLNWDSFASEAWQSLSADNLIWLYAVIVGAKIVHECGHAFACKYFCARDGLEGDVHNLGIMLLFFAPLPYIDVSSSVQIRSRWARAAVGLAGIYSELYLAFIATLVWAGTAEGTALHLLSRNCVIITSVSTLIFNLNPLLRFDGYFVFSDLLNMPNLYQRSQAYCVYLFKRHILGVEKAQTVVSQRSEKIFYPIYAVSAFLYRIVITVSIYFLLKDKLATIGILLTIGLALLWFVIPACKGVAYLLTGPELAGRRGRSNLRFAALLAGILFLLTGIPAESAIITEGVAESRSQQIIFAEVEGNLAEFTPTDKPVGLHEGLARIDNPGLEAELARMRLDARVSTARLEAARDKGDTDAAGRAALDLHSKLQQVEILAAQVARREVRAPIKGVWVAPDLTRRHGKWLSQGDALGMVYAPEQMRVRVVVDQFDAARLFAEELSRVEFCVSGRTDLPGAEGGGDAEFSGFFPARAEGSPTPAGRREVFHPSLARQAGGQLQTVPGQGGTMLALNHYFELRLLPGPEGAGHLRPGQRVMVKLVFGEQPLGLQWLRRIKQFFTRH